MIKLTLLPMWKCQHISKRVQIAKPIKTVPQSTLVGSSALENATIPPQKYALAKNSKGRRTARKNPKLPIIAIIGSFPVVSNLNCF